MTVSNGTTSFSLAIAPPNLFSAETAQNALAGLSIGLVIVPAMLVGSAFDFHRVAWIAVATAALSTVYMLSRMRRSGSIVVSVSALTLPSRLVGRPSSPIDLRKIRSVLVARRGLIPYLLIGEDNRITGVPASRLQGPDALAHLQAQLQAALASLADGEVLAAQMQARNAFGDSLGKVVPIASRCAVALVVVLGVSFGLRAAGAGYLALLDFGANAPVLVRHGEWFRLVLASFLHPTPFETVTAALGFSFFGARLERLAGWHHLVILTMVSSAAGHAAGAYSLGPVSPGVLYTGVLPGIAGLGGALTVIHRRFGKFLPASEQLRGNAATSLMWMLVFLAALDTRSKLLVTAGLLVGGIYGLILCRGKRFPMHCSRLGGLPGRHCSRAVRPSRPLFWQSFFTAAIRRSGCVSTCSCCAAWRQIHKAMPSPRPGSHVPLRMIDTSPGRLCGPRGCWQHEPSGCHGGIPKPPE